MIPLSDTNAHSGLRFWVVVIILLNVYIFFKQLTSVDPDAFILKYALVPANVNFSDLNTLFPFITSQFLHGGFLHIISNMLFLWVFGDNIEDHLGFIVFPIFYILSGIVGAFAQYIFIPDSTIPMLGASGAIAGVLGSYFALFPNNKIKTLVPIFGFVTIMNLPASLMLIYWFVTQLFAGASSFALGGADLGGVAYFAHIGGFVTGLIAGKLYQQSSGDAQEGVLISER